jgi:hypothetical protein
LRGEPRWAGHLETGTPGESDTLEPVVAERSRFMASR